MTAASPGHPCPPALTSRQRFLATATFSHPDRAFLLPPWLWGAALERWQREGLPEGADLCEAFGTDRAAEAEVLSKVPWLCLHGGYFAQEDHLVPPDVTLANYTYYSRLIRAVVEDPERYQHEAERRGLWATA